MYDINHKTALMHAANNGNLDIIKGLTREYGMADSNNNTALFNLIQ